MKKALGVLAFFVLPAVTLAAGDRPGDVLLP